MAPEALPQTTHVESLTFGVETSVTQRLDVHLLAADQQASVQELVMDFVKTAEPGGDSFGPIREIENSLRAIAGASAYEITPVLSEAHRLYSGTLFAHISNYERRGDDDSARQLAAKAYEALFSTSPNIASYSGGPKEQFRLLALAQATPLTRDLSAPMIGELAYTVAYNYPEDIFEDCLQQESPTEQLQAVDLLESISDWAINNGDWAQPAVQKALRALDAAAASPANAHFVRKVAADTEHLLKRELHLEWADLDDLPLDEQERLLALHRERKNTYDLTQQRLRHMFPGLAEENAVLVQVASDAAAAGTHGSFDRLARRTPDGKVHQDRLDTVRGSEALGLSAEQDLLLLQLHRSGVRSLVEQDLGVSLSEISLDAQLQLLDYMTSAETKNYERLSTLINHAPAESRTDLCESFLALEFGKDFGDILLEVGDRLREKPDNLTEILGALQAIRDNAREIATYFSSDNPIDQTLAPAVQLAFIKRTTELLALAADASTEQQARAATALRLLQRLTEETARGLQGDFTNNVAEGQGHETYRAQDAPLTVTIRPDGENARIGFTINLSKDELPPALAVKRRRVSMRLDREADGLLSLDLGSTAQHDVNASLAAKFIGTTLAEGEALLAHRRAVQGVRDGVKRQEITLHGNHVREVFPTDLALDPAAFTAIARRFADRLHRTPV